MIRRMAAALVITVVAAACGPDMASPSPTIDRGAQREFVLGCLSIEQVECELVARRALAELPKDRGGPFGITVHLYGCPNGDPCPRTLSFREGKVTIDWADPLEPLEVSVKGPPAAPIFADVPTAWSGLQTPSSPRVGGAGPFPFDLGHCGLSWQVDFDGSFWLPIGQVDGDASPVINADSGEMRLLAPDLAEYRNAEGFVAQLARFPGPKHVWLCS